MLNTALVTAIRSAGQLSANDPVFTTTELLARATQALFDKFSQPIALTRSGYWLHVASGSTSAGTSLYRLPPRSLLQGLEKLEISLDNGASYQQLSILTQAQAADYSGLTAGQPYAFALESDCVRLFPTPSATYPLRFSYYLRPPALVALGSVGLVLTGGVNNTTKVVQTATDPASLGISTDTGADIQHVDGACELSLVGGTVTNIAGPAFGIYSITFAASTDLSQVVAGDVIRVPDTAEAPMLPVELHRALADYVAADVLISRGDLEKSSPLASKASNAIERMVDVATPRIKTRPYVFKTRNTYLRKRAFWR